MDALHRSQAHAEGRALRVEQSASGEGFHNGNSHVILFTDAVQLRAVGVDSLQSGGVLLRKHHVGILAGGQHIKRRIDTEENHLHITGFRRLNRHLRVVRADTDMANRSAVFQFHDVVQIFGVLNLLPFPLGIHIVNHAQIDIVRLKAFQKIFKSRADVLHVPRPEVLLILPCRTDMPLNIPLAAVLPNALADDISGLRVCHPAVQNVDPLRGRIANQVDAFRLRMALQPLAAESDFADLQSRFAQSSIVHLSFLPLQILIC